MKLNLLRGSLKSNKTLSDSDRSDELKNDLFIIDKDILHEF